MKFMRDNARRFGVRDRGDPKAAIDAAAHYLRDLLVKFNGRFDLALAAYNAGEGTVESFLTGRPLLLSTGKVINPNRLVTGGLPPYPETRAYVNTGLRLLTARSVNSLNSASAFSTHKSRLPVKIRNFSLDALTTDYVPRMPNKKANALFIEVQ